MVRLERQVTRRQGTMKRRRLEAAAFGLAATAAAITLAAGTAATASAASTARPAARPADRTLTLSYPVTGTTYLVGPQTTATLGPGKLVSTADLTKATLSGTLTLPPAGVSFSLLGQQATGTTEFQQVGQATGTLDLSTGAITATTDVTIKITSLALDGLPLYVGPACQTIKPAVITVKSGSNWTIRQGGTLTGTYRIPYFNNCGLLDTLAPTINLLIPRPGNTITLKLGHATTG
jgi:hypothetical protein